MNLKFELESEENLRLRFSYEGCTFEVNTVTGNTLLSALKEVVVKVIPAKKKPRASEIVFNNAQNQPLLFEMTRDGIEGKKVKDYLQEETIYFITLKKREDNFFLSRSSSARGFALGELNQKGSGIILPRESSISSPEIVNSPSKSSDSMENNEFLNREERISSTWTRTKPRKQNSFQISEFEESLRGLKQVDESILGEQRKTVSKEEENNEENEENFITETSTNRRRGKAVVPPPSIDANSPENEKKSIEINEEDEKIQSIDLNPLILTKEDNFSSASFLFMMNREMDQKEEELKLKNLTPDHVIQQVSDTITPENVRKHISEAQRLSIEVNLEGINYEDIDEMLEQAEAIDFLSKMRLSSEMDEKESSEFENREASQSNLSENSVESEEELRPPSISQVYYTSVPLPSPPMAQRSSTFDSFLNSKEKVQISNKEEEKEEISKEKKETVSKENVKEESKIITATAAELESKRAIRASVKQKPLQRPEDLQEMNDDERKEKVQKFKAVVKELIQTERDYVEDLEIVNTIFYQPLNMEDIVPNSDLNELFNNILCILEINRIILEELQKREDDLNGPGTIFMQYNDYLMIYLQYCSHQDRQLLLINELQQKNRNFANFLIAARKNPICRHLPFDSFLSRPVQRICKYPLLLKELINFATEDEQLKVLTLALRKMTDCITEINTRMRFTQSVKRMMEIQSFLSVSVRICFLFFIASSHFRVVTG
eukprot:TRINITY_DN5208_c0_g2_i2.p1 TRINITY_DN5208_c0_g2~~TRINITY_DN5208_c0_g2_i2.p1  ORF type:complete len:722 (-),score=262.47 TRINITY_DN5208_c0_g2_i2:600-2765(-)